VSIDQISSFLQVHFDFSALFVIRLEQGKKPFTPGTYPVHLIEVIGKMTGFDNKFFGVFRGLYGDFSRLCAADV
jgi:hypothetical protein